MQTCVDAGVDSFTNAGKFDRKTNKITPAPGAKDAKSSAAFAEPAAPAR